MLSSKCKYAFRAILFIAIYGSASNKCGIKKIATALEIPQPYLAKIMQNLARKRIISSSKGPNGGFFLTEKNKKQELLSIVRAVDGLLYFETCGLGLEKCSPKRPCPIHYDYIIIRAKFKSLFVSKTIIQLAEEVETIGLSLVT